MLTAKEALQAARAQLGAAQQRMQAAQTALAALPAGSEQTQGPQASTKDSSRKRRVVLSDSEDEGGAGDKDAGMQSSDEEEQEEMQPAPLSRLRRRSKTAARQIGSGGSLEELEQELDHEEECLQVACCMRMPVHASLCNGLGICK